MGTSVKNGNTIVLEQGITLVEAMIAFLILSGGVMGIMNSHLSSFVLASAAKTTSEAVFLAEGKLQELQSFLGPTDSRLDAGSYSDYVEGTSGSFQRDWVISADSLLKNLNSVMVTVSWTDRMGQRHSVILGSEIRASIGVEDIKNILTLIDIAIE